MLAFVTETLCLYFCELHQNPCQNPWFILGWSLQLRPAPWPGRCSPTPGNAGASTTWTPPSQSSASSSPPTLRRRSWARTRSCAWPCATSTSWCSCWRARAVSSRATPLQPCSPCSGGTWSSCSRLHTPGPWPVTQRSPHLDPAATAPRPGRTTAAGPTTGRTFKPQLKSLESLWPLRFMTSTQKHFHISGRAEIRLRGGGMNCYLNGWTTFKACPHNVVVASCPEIIRFPREGSWRKSER